MQATLQNVGRDLGLVFTYLTAAPWVFWVWIVVAFLIGMLVVALYYHQQRRAFEAWKRAEQKAVRDKQVIRRANARVRVNIVSANWRG